MQFFEHLFSKKSLHLKKKFQKNLQFLLKFVKKITNT